MLLSSYAIITVIINSN